MEGLFTVLLGSSLMLFGKLPADAFVCQTDKELTELYPPRDCYGSLNGNNLIYLYIYSKKPFKTDTLTLLFIHQDFKGIVAPKSSVAQTLNVDVDPESNAVKANMFLLKKGLFLVRVYSNSKPEKPIAETQIYVE